MEESSALRRFRAEQVSPPRGWNGRFRLPPGMNQLGSEVSLDLEIGCGAGWHPIAYAKAHPDRFLIAIERTQTKYSAFASRLDRHAPLINLLPVHADAVAWVTHSIEAGSLTRIHLPFPNPCLKNRAQRWIRMPFFSRLKECLKSHGEVVLWTNTESYAREFAEEGEKTWALRLEKFVAYSKTDLAQPRTHFEKKYLERGETCFEVVLRKP